MIKHKQGDSMNGGARLATGSLIGVLLAISLTACGHRGDLTIINNGLSDVTVLTGDDETSVSASGGTVAHDYGCTPGDVTVKFASGQEIVLPGPVCPDQRIMVGDGTATLQPVSSSDT